MVVVEVQRLSFCAHGNVLHCSYSEETQKLCSLPAFVVLCFLISLSQCGLLSVWCGLWAPEDSGSKLISLCICSHVLLS